MDLSIFVDHRFLRDADGAFYSTGSYTYDFYSDRYLRVFDEVYVLARVKTAPDGPPPGRRADGPRVHVIDLGDWSTLRGTARSIPNMASTMRPYVTPDRAVILVCPGRIAALAARLMKRPFAVEMVGDPIEQFASKSIAHVLRPVMAGIWPRIVKRTCAGASAINYVTETTLQQRYPAAPDAFATSSSNVAISEFAARPRTLGPGPLHVVFVGSLSGLHKGPDVLLEAVRRSGIDARVTIVGGGRSLDRLRRDYPEATFTGQLAPGPDIVGQLDQADLFVLPSLSEGLPRALIEAMSRGLPCIATAVGGVPELLEPDDLVPAGDVAALESKLRAVAGDPQRMAAMAARNLARSHDFARELLDARRQEFYRHVAQLQPPTAVVDQETPLPSMSRT